MQPVDEPFKMIEEKSKNKLSRLLRLLVIDMRTSAILMALREGREWEKHAYELTGAADMVGGWSQIAKAEEKEAIKCNAT